MYVRYSLKATSQALTSNESHSRLFRVDLLLYNTSTKESILILAPWHTKGLTIINFVSNLLHFKSPFLMLTESSSLTQD